MTPGGPDPPVIKINDTLKTAKFQHLNHVYYSFLVSRGIKWCVGHKPRGGGDPGPSVQYVPKYHENYWDPDP